MISHKSISVSRSISHLHRAQFLAVDGGSGNRLPQGERHPGLVALVVGLLACLISYTDTTVVAQPLFSNAASLGSVAVPGLNQASGVVASRNNDGVLWTHNDAGDSPRIFAIDLQGRHLGTYQLPGAKHVDYEDLAIGPGPVPNAQYLFVGDIGDNKSNRPSIQVYRIPEPAVYLRQSLNPVSRSFKGLESITLNYPDGAHNAETLLVDPLTGDLFVVTKQPGLAGIYQATKIQLESGSSIILSHVGQIPFNVASGGDISPTGREIVIRQEDFARLWTRTNQQSIPDALLSTPTIIPVVGRPAEPNGEAIGFDRLGSGYFTLSDSASTQPLYYFSRVSPFEVRVPQTLLSAGARWSYLDDGSNLGSAWRTNGFDDGGWQSGEGQFGFGDGDEQTVVSYGASASAKHLTTYFRTTFITTNIPESFQLQLSLLFSDGAAVYLNGTSIALANLSGSPTSLTPATGPQDGLEDTWLRYAVDAALLMGGTNTLAVEVHLSDPSRPHLSFDAQLSLIETQPMKIKSLHRLTDGRLELNVQSDIPELDVEASTNLRTWFLIGHVSLVNGTGVFSGPKPSDTAESFFRLRAP